MRRRTLLFGIGVAFAIAVAGCAKSSYNTPQGGSSGTYGSGAYGSAAPSAPPPASGAVATVSVSKAPLGDVLVDSSGRTLYLFEKDTGTTSTCTGGCAQTWPALTTSGTTSTAGPGADQSKLGTTPRPDGTVQVTYNGHPLYRYGADTSPGDTKGQGVGNVWYAVSPAGNKVGS